MTRTERKRNFVRRERLRLQQLEMELHVIDVRANEIIDECERLQERLARYRGEFDDGEAYR